MCDLLGHANETDILVGEERCLALVDTGSMITSIGESFYRDHLEDQYTLHEINHLVKVEGAGGHQLTY